MLDPDGRLEKATFALQQNFFLFNHLVGAGEQPYGISRPACSGTLKAADYQRNQL
jgi:hypothetical protein